MRKFAVFCGLLVSLLAMRAAEPLPIEQQVAEAVKAQTVTIVHFWAPWCPNCKAELTPDGWAKFIAANPEVNVIFVTVQHPEDGQALLERSGVGGQKNFQLLLHPNPSRKREDKMTSFMGLPVSWVPTTWVYRDGKLRYAINYGEVRFDMLQQMVADSLDKWSHAKPAAPATTAAPAVPEAGGTAIGK